MLEVLAKDQATRRYHHDWIETFTLCSKSKRSVTSRVVQWMGIHLPKQGTWVQSLGWEDPKCHTATEPRSHNY